MYCVTHITPQCTAHKGSNRITISVMEKHCLPYVVQTAITKTSTIWGCCVGPGPLPVSTASYSYFVAHYSSLSIT